MPINQVQSNGWLKTINDNFATAMLQIAQFTFNTAELDANGVSNKTVAAHPTEIELPAHAIICGGFFDVNTVLTSAAGTAEVAIHVEGAGDIQAAAAVSGAPYSTIGRKAIVPKANTPESTSVKTTVARKVTVTVTVQALTAGKLTGYLYYIPGVASA